jgi:CBS domain-containing protein/sporulation protein YlmC with PRC-barrel domain
MNNGAERTFLLSDLIGLKAYMGKKRIGKLADIVISDADKAPEVTHFVISRPYGGKSLMVPWAKVGEIGPRSAGLAIEAPEPYEAEPVQGQVLLKDHLLDKKVLDCDDDEVEVVYDVKLALRRGKLYATDIDCSRAAFLRRLGLKSLANWVREIASQIKDDTIPWSYVQRLPEDIGSFKGDLKLNVLKEKLPEIHPVDLADILEELDQDERLAIFSQLDTEQASDTLEEVEPRVQRELIAALDKKRAAELINDMTPAQAADILAVLPAPEAEALLNMLDAADAGKIRHLLEHHDDSIAYLATAHYIAFPPETLIGEVFRQYRLKAPSADVVMYIYVVDELGKLVGTLDIRELLQAAPEQRLEDVMTTNLVTLNANTAVKDAVKLFVRYAFRAIPIVDDGGVMTGALPYRDVMNMKPTA